MRDWKDKDGAPRELWLNSLDWPMACKHAPFIRASWADNAWEKGIHFIRADRLEVEVKRLREALRHLRERIYGGRRDPMTFIESIEIIDRALQEPKV